MVLSVERLLGLPVVWLGIIVVMLLVRRQVIAWARQMAGSQTKAGDSRLVLLLNRIYVPGLLLAGLYISLEVLPVEQRYARYVALGEKWLAVLALLVALALAWRGLSMLITFWAETNPNAGTLVPPVQLLGRMLLVIVGIALIFTALNYDLTKAWTALGLGTVAVALGLQETLSNIFAGFHVMLDQPIRIGDYVRLDTGEEGRVTQIGWRSTRLTSLANNVVVVPNSKLSRASMTNFTMPQPRLAVSFVVGVSYDSDTRRVCAILQDELDRGSREIEGMLAEPAPAAAFSPGFGDSSLNFTVGFQVREFTAQFAVQQELRHRIFARLQKEGIAIPFPTREIRVKQASQAE